MRLSKQIALAIIIFSVVSCNVQNQEKEQSIVQVSTIDALLQGVYDGQTTLKEIRKLGDFGIGTFNNLDGEMVLVDGELFQVKSDGKIYSPEDKDKTPFATVTNFEEERSFDIEQLSYQQLKLIVDSLMDTENLFYAIRVKGKFEYVKTRSVPAQAKPYPPLVEVTKNQPEFEIENVSGQLVGFYCPKYLKGVNVPEYHLHFLSDGKQFGGHLLAFNLIEGELILDKINRFEMLLPNDGGFLDSEFETDRSEELKTVEQ